MWLSVLLAGGLIIHFGAVLLASFSTTYLPEKVWYVVAPYVNPIFYQNFKVFAPEPPTQSRSVLFRYRNDQGWSDWRWPGFEHLYYLQRNRLSYHAEFFDMSEGMADNLYWTMQKPGFMLSDGVATLKQFPAMDVAYREAEKQFSDLDGVEAVQFGLFIEHTSLEDDHIKREYSFQAFPNMELP